MLCRWVSPAVAQEMPAAPQAVSLSLKPTSSHLSLRLRAEGGAYQDYACPGPCVLDGRPGRYQLGVVDARGVTGWHPGDRAGSETIEISRSHRGWQNGGTALLVTGVGLAVVGGAAFIYGAVNNLEASGCDTSCGAVSGRFLRLSLAGAGVGLVLAAVGGAIVYDTRGPTMVERPGVEPEPTVSNPRSSSGRLSCALLPDLHAPRLPVASMNLTF